MSSPKWRLSEDRLFDSDPVCRGVAHELYRLVADLPIISPHGHVSPQLLADPYATLGTPAELLIIPDHYVFRMLYSQRIPLESLGVPGRDGQPVEKDHRRIWQLFADNFHLFRGTPTGAWLTQELHDVFDVKEEMNRETAQHIYDHLEAKLALPEFRPRALFERFNIEVLCTTDAATDRLLHHQATQNSGWSGNVRPTFRPDAVVDLLAPQWRENIDALSEASNVAVHSYSTFIRALEERRGYFKRMRATATDHAVESA